ncbi:hypothetical protein GGD83_004680 [Rhodoblastus sphagnicola]|nr:hypothetical protein [Rhodoblastus sphagnicola]MBB4200851.1 hypothetical protein [Rhodoblastus sphagnicola]
MDTKLLAEIDEINLAFAKVELSELCDAGAFVRAIHHIEETLKALPDTMKTTERKRLDAPDYAASRSFGVAFALSGNQAKKATGRTCSTLHISYSLSAPIRVLPLSKSSRQAFETPIAKASS